MLSKRLMANTFTKLLVVSGVLRKGDSVEAIVAAAAAWRYH